MNDDLIKRLRAAADAVMDYQWSGDRERMAALHELCQAESAAADALEAQAAELQSATDAAIERCAQWLDAEHQRKKHFHNYAACYAREIRALKEKQ
jgi:hypothetical protein